MASPVNTSVKWARSSMPDAPVLTRAAGSLIALLDALLVNGWGVQTATSVVVAGGVATATFASDHAGARHAVVLVAGVTGSLAGLNGEQKVTAVEPNKIKWATTEANGTATGTITIKMAPAGFAKPFSGTNLAVYKSANPDSHGQFLRINDTTAEYCRAVGYENMTAISTGTGLFPSAAQVNGGYYWGKGADSSGTDPVPYSFASDGRIFYIMVQAGASFGTGALSHAVYGFGDMLPLSPAGDPWATALIGNPDTNLAGNGAFSVWSYNSADTYWAAPRPFGGVGTSVRGVATPELNINFGGTNPDLPDPISGGVPMGRVLYRDNTTSFPRAYPPGVNFCPGNFGEKLFAPMTIAELHDGKAYLVTLAGQQQYSSSATSPVLFDITGPWR